MEQTTVIFTTKQSKEGGAFKTLANPQQLRAVMAESLQALTLDREKLKEFFKNAARQGLSFHSYSFNNLMLAWFQKKDFEILAGMKQWNKAGRSVKKGEKAIYILAPCWGKKNEDGTEEAEKSPRRSRPLFFKSVKVFDIKQTEGKPIDWGTLTGLGFVRADGEDGGAQTWEMLKAFTDAAGLTLEEKNTAEAGGYISGGHICVHSELSTAAKCSVLLHELGHYKYSHQTEAGRELTKEVKEAEAEIFSYITGQCFGINNDFTGMYLAAYLKHYKDADIYSLFKYIIDGAMSFLSEVREFSKLGIADLKQISKEDRERHTKEVREAKPQAAGKPPACPNPPAPVLVSEKEKPAPFFPESLRDAAEIVKKYERLGQLIDKAERQGSSWAEYLRRERAEYEKNLPNPEGYSMEKADASRIEVYSETVQEARQESARLRLAIKSGAVSNIKEIRAQLIQFENLIGA